MILQGQILLDHVHYWSFKKTANQAWILICNCCYVIICCIFSGFRFAYNLNKTVIFFHECNLWSAHSTSLTLCHCFLPFLLGWGMMMAYHRLFETYWINIELLAILLMFFLNLQNNLGWWKLWEWSTGCEPD